MFRNYLTDQGVSNDRIISIKLDGIFDLHLRNPFELTAYVRSRVEYSNDLYFLFVDEIQMADEVPNPYNREEKKITFYDALNDLRSIPNLNIYVTGSNSKMLSSDILTEFRGRSDEISDHPLSFSEFYSAVGGDKEDAFESYAFYGEMLLIFKLSCYKLRELLG